MDGEIGVTRLLGPEAAKNLNRRRREGFFETYLSGDEILDIGYEGATADVQPITDKATGVDLDYPGYDGKALPFGDGTQDAIFASHVLEHIEDFSFALREWYRVLKIGGYLIIAVPHRDLYERKASLPSRFNADHKRFYTPASLLCEVEGALPVGGFRIRSLKDVDEGFDYMIQPQIHAIGSYEIELVLQKISVPEYAYLLRPLPVRAELVAFYSCLLKKAVMARHHGRVSDVQEIQKVLSGLPLPPFRELVERVLPDSSESDALAELREIMVPLVAGGPFDECWYLSKYPDLAKVFAEDSAFSARSHFIEDGYFAGRAGCAYNPVFR